MPEVDDVLTGRYQLEAVIASGGMATVWRARDQVLARPVAVKILHEHLADDEAFLARFRREAISAAGLTHPHVVSIYDTGEMEEPGSRCHYIVMEHCGGGTLGQLLAASGPFRPERVAGVGGTICDALSYAHSKGIVHRDVKPANVLIGDDELLKVGDFGIAKAVAEKGDITTTGKIMGTVAYISPEYASDQELDARSDIYSLGVVLYELAVGRPPFQEATSVATAMRHVNDPPPSLRSMRAGIPRSLESVILKALAKDPDHRFASAQEMRESLEDIAPGASGHHMVAPATRRIPAAVPSTFRNESKWIVPVVSLIVGAIILAALAAAIFNDESPAKKGAAGQPGAPGAPTIEIASVSDFDPYEKEEHSELAPLAIDGNPGTSWTTENYSDSFDLIDKPGVGLLFDLGSSADVAAVEITSPAGIPFELFVGDDPPTDENDLQRVDSGTSAADGVTLSPDAAGRYWLVWITGLPGGSGSTSIAEVKFFGP